MTPARRWMLWAAALFVITGVVDVVLLHAGTAAANARPAQETGVVVSRVLSAALLLGLAATALFWWHGRTQEPGNRLVATIAFLIAQGLLFAFLSMAMLLATPHRRWDEMTAHGRPTNADVYRVYSCDRFTGAAPASAMRHRYRLA
jgi:nitrate reductase gamma subunit